MTRASRWLIRRIADLLAAAGAVALVALVVGAVAQLSLVVFASGSMAPTMPTGAVALVHRIGADEVRVGDVVTVDRPGQLPVTHRVVAVARPDDGRTRVLTLRGDANASPDPTSYTVTHVRRVVASVPAGATVLVAVRRPATLGALSVLVAALVTWSFWPRPAPSDVDVVEDRRPVMQCEGWSRPSSDGLWVHGPTSRADERRAARSGASPRHVRGGPSARPAPVQR